MFKFVLLVCLVGFTVARNDNIDVVKYNSQVNGDGSYGYEYVLSNGVTVQESGVGGQYANGGFRHYSPEGQLVELAYTADANGFRPIGSHVPTPPPVPEYILKSIRYIEQHPTKEELVDRQVRLKYNQ